MTFFFRFQRRISDKKSRNISSNADEYENVIVAPESGLRMGLVTSVSFTSSSLKLGYRLQFRNDAITRIGIGFSNRVYINQDSGLHSFQARHQVFTWINYFGNTWMTNTDATQLFSSVLPSAARKLACWINCREYAKLITGRLTISHPTFRHQQSNGSTGRIGEKVGQRKTIFRKKGGHKGDQLTWQPADMTSAVRICPTAKSVSFQPGNQRETPVP